MPGPLLSVMFHALKAGGATHQLWQAPLWLPLPVVLHHPTAAPGGALPILLTSCSSALLAVVSLFREQYLATSAGFLGGLAQSL